MNGKYFEREEAEAIKQVLKKPNRIVSPINLFVRWLIGLIILGFLILSPILFGFLWYHFIVADALSSAIIGITCGLIFDFFVLLFMQ